MSTLNSMASAGNDHSLALTSGVRQLKGKM
jgi:hypothetical protein